MIMETVKYLWKNRRYLDGWSKAGWVCVPLLGLLNLWWGFTGTTLNLIINGGVALFAFALFAVIPRIQRETVEIRKETEEIRNRRLLNHDLYNLNKYMEKRHDP